MYTYTIKLIRDIASLISNQRGNTNVIVMDTSQRCRIYGRQEDMLITLTVSVIQDFLGAILRRVNGKEEGKVVNQAVSHT